MDHQFPPKLFPSFYNRGPPEQLPRGRSGGWGAYGGVSAQGGSGPLSSWTFTSRRRVDGEVWRQTEPLPVPLLSPRKAFQEYLMPPDPMDFLSHLQNFFIDDGLDAFRCTSEVLGENFYFKKAKKKEKYRQGSVNMWRTKSYIDLLKYKPCPVSYPSRSLERFSSHMSDVVHDVPLELLGSLLYEELTEQRERMQFSERSTGGALAYVPFSQSEGCLLYPGGLGMDRLHFHKVALQNSCMDASSAEPVSFQLRAPVRQISCGSVLGDCCVAVRSDYHCGVWRFGERKQPCLLQVVDAEAAATCVSVSPHVLGEVLVVSESGAANLWTVGKGLQKVRTEESNLYFNAKSPWRWCEFSAHPRVMVYADRTGAELTDFRAKVSGAHHTLFRISSTSDCRSGERLLLCRYLGDVNTFHHLVATQAPPLFCHVASDRRMGETAKVLLGSHSSQEITLLQYSGGRLEACSSRGAPQALLRPTDSLTHLPVQIPHRQQAAAQRLASPAAGLTCFQKKGGAEDFSLCVLQLTEVGDIFYQILERRPPAEDKSGAPEAQTSEQVQVSDPARHGDIITAAPETPDRIVCLDSSTEGAEDESGTRKKMPVAFNDEPGLDAEVCGGEEVDRSSCWEAPLTISSSTAETWKLWLQKLRLTGQNPETVRPQNFVVQTAGLLQAADRDAGGELDEPLRREMKGCMRRRSLLLNDSASIKVPLTVPALVNAEAWTDALSDRLTAAWRGEEEWQAWWRDQLGTNRKMKADALRRKRRMQKEARRAEGRRFQLSGSFTSSVSYQTDLDDPFESTGWSSAVSQGTLSDEEDGAVLQSEEDRTLPVTATPDPIRTTTPQKYTPSRPRPLLPTQPNTPQTPRANQRSWRPQDDFLSSVWGTQDAPPQSEEPLPSSWFPGSQSGSLRPSPGSLPSSQASQSQRGPSQASQPKRKKSRMGF
ncbi:TATA box-binding protein-associated factor RNA polymerase I subunit C isoform X2 [Cyprinodon tularosa]|uniref:TATA box-binding protein-associated factor RNA polymerase I subunit C isoform X2 n=1 Tax=Cyprinodon tularosa TaxID=77115 RepID=UPI0018E28BD2|nr:TATA box-binding protein-associated factor RNA polymerase I subunit C isoform X2 [Cyprinodon tularosa]